MTEDSTGIDNVLSSTITTAYDPIKNEKPSMAAGHFVDAGQSHTGGKTMCDDLQAILPPVCNLDNPPTPPIDNTPPAAASASAALLVLS